MSGKRISLGKIGEEIARKYLQKIGYRIVCSNYRQQQGEIDIVAEDGEFLVFIEVKTRSGLSFGDPLEAVNSHKRRQIARAATRYMAENNCFERPARFDVVGVRVFDDGTSSLELVKGAFSLDMDS